MKRLLFALACVAFLVVGGLAVMSWFSHKPPALGVADGRLTECPDTPNCVSTQAADPPQRMEPIRFDGSPREAMQRIRQLVQGLPRTKIVTAEDDYLHAEFRSRLFGFVDDVEFLVDAEQPLIHFRSASRVGYSDLGANRRRMEQLARMFREGGDPGGPPGRPPT